MYLLVLLILFFLHLLLILVEGSANSSSAESDVPIASTLRLVQHGHSDVDSDFDPAAAVNGGGSHILTTSSEDCKSIAVHRIGSKCRHRAYIFFNK